MSSTGLAMPFGNVLMIDSENIEASTRRYERNGDDLTGRSFSKTGDENIKERNEQPVLTNLESEKGYSSGSVLFRPNKNPYPTAKSPSVSQIFWGEVKTKSIKAPFKMDDLDSKECLVRVTVQDKPNIENFLVLIQQSNLADSQWVAPIFKWMHSGDSLKLLKTGLAHIGLWINYNVPMVDGWIDLGSPGVDLVYAPQPWVSNLFRWQPLLWCDTQQVSQVHQGNNILVQHVQGDAGGPSLVLFGYPPLGKHPHLNEPKDWLDLARDAVKKGQLVYLKGLQRSVGDGDKIWYPMALLAQAGLLQGMILCDEGDEEQYRAWLQAGFTLGIMADSEICRGEKPVGVQNRLYRSDTEEPIEVLAQNRLICAEDMCLQLNLDQEVVTEGNVSSLSRVLSIGDKSRLEGIFLPRLTFECGPMTRGIRTVELYKGTSLIQLSQLYTPLREGRSHFAPENFQAGDAITVVLEDVNGKRHMSNPIFFVGSSNIEVKSPFPVTAMPIDEIMYISDKTLTALDVIQSMKTRE